MQACQPNPPPANACHRAGTPMQKSSSRQRQRFRLSFHTPVITPTVVVRQIMPNFFFFNLKVFIKE